MDRLKEILKSSSLDNYLVAKDLGIDEANFYEWINGEYLPSYDNLIKIADYFGVSLDYLFGRSEDMTECHTKYLIPFKDNLLNLLDENHITKYRLFKDCGFSNNTKVAWFSKGAKPSAANILKIADYFKISVDEAIGRVI